VKVGDLVKKCQGSADVIGVDFPCLGVIVNIEASERHYKVHWGEYGIFWTPWDVLELISESR